MNETLFPLITMRRSNILCYEDSNLIMNILKRNSFNRKKPGKNKMGE